MKPAPFVYHDPRTAAEACDLLATLENARQFLKDNPDIRAEIDTRLRKGLGLPVVEAPAEAPAKGEKAAVLPMPEKKKA